MPFLEKCVRTKSIVVAECLLGAQMWLREFRQKKFSQLEGMMPSELIGNELVLAWGSNETVNTLRSAWKVKAGGRGDIRKGSGEERMRVG